MTKCDIERDIEALEDAVDETGESSAADLSVEWHEAAPEDRPSGVAYDPATRTLTYDLWQAQQECRDALEHGAGDIVALLGGYGAGKSILGARWTIANAIQHPESRFLAMGQSFAEADASTFTTLFEQLPGEQTARRTASFNGPEQSPIVADYNRSRRRLTLTNGTVITLGSTDTWSRYAGAEFGGIWLDEPSHYGTDLHDLLEMLGSRLRGVDGPKRQCWTLTGNGYNDAWRILEQQQDTTGEPIGLEIEVVRASTLANPYLTHEDIDRFERQYANTERATQALHGGFAAAQGLVYSGFRRDAHVIPAAEAVDCVRDGWRIYGYDAGWRDPRVLLEIGKTDYGQYVVLDEFHETESHVKDAIEWLQHESKPRGSVFAEHEPADIKQLRQARYPAYKAKKAIDPGIEDVRRRLEKDETDRVGLVVSDRCKYLIQEFLDYKEEQVGTTQAVDHCLDALRYAIHTADERYGRESGAGNAGPRSGSSSTVIKSGSKRAKRRDRHRSQSRLRSPRSIDEVSRR
jgi:hypothetical protein